MKVKYTRFPVHLRNSKSSYQLIIFLLVSLFSINPSDFLYAQHIEWGRQFDNPDARDMTVDNDNNIILIGQFQSVIDVDPGPSNTYLTCNGADDSYIVKLDSNGNYIWSFSIGGVEWDYGISVTNDFNNNIYITGRFRNSVDFDPGSGTSILTSTLQGQVHTFDIFLAKYDKNGNYLWAIKMGGDGQSSDAGMSVDTDDNGYIYLTGSFSNIVNFDPINNSPGSTLTSTDYINNPGYLDIFIAKYNPNGELNWVKQIGGITHDIGHKIEVKNKYVYVSGRFSHNVDFNPGPNVDLMTTLDSITNNYSMMGFLTKFDDNGNYFWSRKIDNTPYVYSDPPFISIDDNENVYISGGFRDSVIIDNNTSNVTLYSESIGNINSEDVFFLKYNSQGSLVWSNTILGQCYNKLIKIDNNGAIYITGTVIDTTDFDPGQGSYNVNTKLTNIYISKYNPNGFFERVVIIPGYYSFRPIDLEFDLSNNLILTGYFEVAPVDFDFGPDSLIMTPPNSSPMVSADIFLVKYNELGTNINNISNQKESRPLIFPNPTSHYFSIMSNELVIKVVISDINGKEVLTTNYVNGINISTEGLANGVYMVNIISENSTTTKKLVISK